MGEDGPGTLPRGPTNLAEVFGGDSVVVPAGQLVHKSQHLVLGLMNSDLMGLHGARRRKRGAEQSVTPLPPRLVSRCTAAAPAPHS